MNHDPSETFSPAEIDAILRAIDGVGPASPRGHAPADALADRMRGDRDRLRASAVEPCPEGLLGRAMDVALGAESVDEILRRLGDGQPVNDHLPESMVIPFRRGWTDRFSTRAWAGVGLAASLVLVSGLVAFFAASRPTTPMSGQPIASAGATSAPAVAPTARPAETTPATPDDQVLMAAAPTLSDPTLPHPTPTGATESDFSIAAVGEPVNDLFAAADLMRAGRLVLVGHAGSAARVKPSLAALTQRSIGTAHSFALEGGLPDDVFDALALPVIAQPVFADDGPGRELITLPEQSAWKATVRDSTNALAALVRGLEDAGLRVEMRSIPQPIGLDPMPTAEDVVWWTRPPSTWGRSRSVPVVVRTLDE